MKKKMGCKADGEAKYRSNLSVVRILANPTTKQIASFCAPSPAHIIHGIPRCRTPFSIHLAEIP